MDAFESAFQNVISWVGNEIHHHWDKFVETILWFAKDQSIAMGFLRDDNPILWHTVDFIDYVAARLSLRVPSKCYSVRFLDFEPRIDIPREVLLVSCHPIVSIHWIQSM